MASAEGGSVPSGVGYGEGCPLSSRLRGLGERRELPRRGPGHPGRKRILAYFEGHRTLIFVPMTKPGGTICISVPAPNSGGTCPLCPPPVIYAHGCGDDIKDWSGKSLWQSAIGVAGGAVGAGAPQGGEKIVGVIYKGKL